MRLSLRSPLLALILVALTGAHGEDEAPVPRPDGVADEVTLDQFQEILSNSPFRRLMSFTDDLMLTGVAKLPSGTVVTVYDRRAEETYSVSAAENAQGWRLVDVTGGRELDDVEATIVVGKQEVTLRFDQRRLTPEMIRRYQPRTVKPARQPEKPSVEQWLATLDPNLLKVYDQLDEPRQEAFRYDFESYLEEYPHASTETRTFTARERLDNLVTQEATERATSPNDLENLNVGNPTP